MPPKIRKNPCYNSVTTRLDANDLEAFDLVAKQANITKAEFLRRLVRAHLAGSAEPPAF